VDGDFTELRQRLAEISDLGRARALLAWDERTMMPRGGAEARADQLATLARLRHERLASDELASLLDALRPRAERLPYDSDEASLVRVAQRDSDKARRVPAELRAEITRTASVAEHAWVEARRSSDFSLFAPHLERNVELKRRYAECFEPFDHPYDPLLDDFEPEAKTAAVRPVLEELRRGLVPLIDAVRESGHEVDDSPLRGSFPIARQRELVGEVIAGLPLPADTWRLDETVHPFATAIATDDVRLTTRYDEAYLGTALWGAMHEAGHALYETGIDSGLRRTPLCRAPSLGFHESQSRLWENWVGRSRGFIEHLRPRLATAFPDELANATAEQIYRAANRVEPSLIRVEADEVTYNLHIVLRFELELQIFDRTLALEDLPEAWSEHMREYLGVDVPDDARGVLQDVHWAAGSFGYFPTYALGNLIAAQIWDSASAALDDLDAMVGRGELGPLREWLREHLHRHGGKFTPAEMLERLVGGLSVDPCLRHLERRVRDVYDLGASAQIVR
jgi:carboxypeptidase Taq